MKIFPLLVFSFLSGQVLAAESLNIAVAANAKYVFDELAAEFGKTTGIKIKSVVASSGKITAQIKNGAPYDVFLSADTEFPETLSKEGYTTAPPKVYAYGTLVLWTQKNLDLSRSVAVLKDIAVVKVAVANPKVSPYGQETLKVLDYYNLRKVVEQKLVYGESISQVNQYVDLNAVDVGFTAKSVVLAPEMAGKGKWTEVPKESYEVIAQAAVILKHGSDKNAEAAGRFFDFLFSHPARTIFEKYGYVLP